MPENFLFTVKGHRAVVNSKKLSEAGEAVEWFFKSGVSELRETDQVGVVDQPPFLNGAVSVETTLSPRALLDLLLEVERSLGRVRGERWGPRVVDLDLLVYGIEVLDEPGLHVPHPRLHERRFALEPLAEMNPELEIPGRGTVSALLAALD